MLGKEGHDSGGREWIFELGFGRPERATLES